MHMRKGRHARLANLSQRCAGADRVAHAHSDRTLFQVAILGFPAAAMVHQHAVAAFLAGDMWIKIRDPVAQAFDRAGGGGKHVHAARHLGAGRKGNIGAVVTIVT